MHASGAWELQVVRSVLERTLKLDFVLELVAKLTLMYCDAGDVMCNQDDEADSMYFVASGTCEA